MNNMAKAIICLVVITCTSATVYATGMDEPGRLIFLGEQVRAAALNAKEVTDAPVTVEDMITTEADNAGVDGRLALAIAKLETGHFTSDAYLYGNNVGGLSRNEIPMTFVSLEDGISAFIACLETYFDKGLNTPELMSSVYCPPDPTGWAAKVLALM